MRLALIGCGSIGNAVATAIAQGCLPGIELAGITDLPGGPGAARAAALQCPYFADVPELLGAKPDLVLEAATADVARAFAAEVLDGGADLMIVSVGALSDPEFFGCLTARAKSSGRRIYVPSGAIGGLDIIKAAALGGLDECRLTTTKTPRALRGAPGVRGPGIDLESIQEATTIFEGTASQAVRLFPQNLNVAAAVSLAGLGLEKTTVRIIADPGAATIYMRSSFADVSVRLPSGSSTGPARRTRNPAI
jgi:aspartate dehydrogenase